MKSNSLLTYVLYGLLGLFILTAGYYACQKQKDKKEQAAREAAEMEETLREMGYASEDTTAATGSSFTSKDSLSKSTTTTKPTVNTTKPTATTTTPATGSKTDVKDKSAPIAKAPVVKTPTSSPATSEPKKSVTKVSGPGSGRWVVRAGTFTYVEGARTRLEDVIKAGYPNAEISKTKEGMFAVIVYRSNDKEAANRAVEKLQTRNIDAAVFAQK